MKLHEQNQWRRAGCSVGAADLYALASRLDRKTAAPYGDGSYSGLVNYSDFRSDLLRVASYLSGLGDPAAPCLSSCGEVADAVIAGVGCAPVPSVPAGGVA